MTKKTSDNMASSDFYKIRSYSGCVSAAFDLLCNNFATIFKKTWLYATLLSVICGMYAFVTFPTLPAEEGGVNAMPWLVALAEMAVAHPLRNCGKQPHESRVSESDKRRHHKKELQQAPESIAHPAGNKHRRACPRNRRKREHGTESVRPQGAAGNGRQCDSGHFHGIRHNHPVLLSAVFLFHNKASAERQQDEGHIRAQLPHRHETLRIPLRHRHNNNSRADDCVHLHGTAGFHHDISIESRQLRSGERRPDRTAVILPLAFVPHQYRGVLRNDLHHILD